MAFALVGNAVNPEKNDPVDGKWDASFSAPGVKTVSRKGVFSMPEFNFDTEFQRLKLAASGACDRPPVFAQMHEFTMRQSGLTCREFYSNPEKYVRQAIATSREFGIDIPEIPAFGDSYNIEAEALGATILYEDDHSPTKTLEPLISSEKELAALNAPNPETDGRMKAASQCLTIFKELTGISVGHECCAPLSLAVQLAGYQPLAMQMLTNPGYVHRILRFLTEEVIAPYARMVIRDNPGCPGVSAADALSSLPLFTEEMIAEFSLPYIVRLKELCGGSFTVRNWVGDSKSKNLEGYWSKKLAVGSGILEVQDPDLHRIGVEKVLAYAEKRELPVILGVGAEFMANGSIPEVTARVKEYLTTGNDRKRRILYLCNLDYNFDPEKLKAIIACVNEVGYAD